MAGARTNTSAKKQPEIIGLKKRKFAVTMQALLIHLARKCWTYRDGKYFSTMSAKLSQ
jgi:hypothetical protein